MCASDLEFEGKAHSLEELQADWTREDQEIAAMKAAEPRFSRYGGSLQYKTSGTGFFRVEQIDGKWWFVDPDGHLFLSLGANGIGPNTSANFAPPKGAYTVSPPEGFDARALGITFRPAPAEGVSPVDEPVMPGAWNLFRR